MTYILIVLILSTNGSVGFSQEFNSIETCKSAQEYVLKDKRLHLMAECLPK